MIAVSGTTLIFAGCTHPLALSTEAALREELIKSHRVYLETVGTGPVIELKREKSVVAQELTQENRLDKINRSSGPNAYADEQLVVGPDLMGESESPVVHMDLQKAVQMASRNNLDVTLARLAPAISEARIIQAEAIFDVNYFAEYNYNNLDTPAPPATIADFGATRTREAIFRTGIRKNLTTGGQIELSTDWSRRFRSPTVALINTIDNANLALTLTQPLLRNFGSDVTMAEIHLTRNARKNDRQRLRQTLLDTAANTEAAYWNLVFARHQLHVATKLYRNTEVERKRLKERLALDVKPATYTEVLSRTEQRRAEVIRNQNQLRQASDRLKILINDNDLSISGETLILPSNSPVDAPVNFSVVDAVTAALRNRPEMQSALLAINDATIRQRVADNQRLPELNLNATIRYNGIGNDFAQTYETIGDGSFIDYLIGLQFEIPLGNRLAEAQARRFSLERSGSVVAYQITARDVVIEVKEALRDLHSAFALIGATQSARWAAARSLETIQAEEDAGARLTPEFINLKLDRQERLAGAELSEMQSLVGYNNAVAIFYRSIGTLLERNRITFADLPVAD